MSDDSENECGCGEIFTAEALAIASINQNLASL